jgi:hypothetical protein
MPDRAPLGRPLANGVLTTSTITGLGDDIAMVV